MKKTNVILGTLLCVGVLALSAATIDKMYVWRGGKYTPISLQDIIWNSTTQVAIGDSTYSISDIDSITFKEPVITGETVTTDTVYIA